MLKDGKYFYTIDYEKNYDIIKGVSDELNINSKYINKYFLISKKEFDIYVVDINKNIKLDSDSQYNWRTYTDFYTESDNYPTVDIYYNIVKYNTSKNKYIIEIDHIENYLCSDYDENKNVIQLRNIYSKLIGEVNYRV